MSPLEGIVIGSPQPGVAGVVGTQVGVPKLVGKPREEAVRELNGLGLKANVVEIVTSGAEGTVFTQAPPDGSLRGVGAVVTLHIIRNVAAQQGLPADKLDLVATQVQNLSQKLDAVSANVALVGNVATQVQALAQAVDTVKTEVAKIGPLSQAVDVVKTEVAKIGPLSQAVDTVKGDVMGKLGVIEGKLPQQPTDA